MPSMTVRARCIAGLALALLSARERGAAQGQPAAIPLVVVDAVSGYFSDMFGRPTYYVGRTPPSWPAALVPAGARVIGGGSVGGNAMFAIQTAVFALPQGSNADATLRALAARAGYAVRPEKGREAGGGFRDSRRRAEVWCKGQSNLMSYAVDSTSPRQVTVRSMNGDIARQNCGPLVLEFGRSGPAAALKIPLLVPPSGTVMQAGGTGWGASSAHLSATLRTTMPVDSIVMHYTAQLVAAGWKAEPMLASSTVGIQKYTFRNGETAWSAALLVMAAGDMHTLELRLAVVDAED